VQHCPDQEANARLFQPSRRAPLFRVFIASIAISAMTSDTAADLCTIGPAPA
jgi:hypothetical protein